MNQQLVQSDNVPREGQDDTQGVPVTPEPADEAQASEAFAAANERLVPVSEAKRYRKRAQAAEATLEEVKSQLEANEAQIQKSAALIESLERRIAIDELLVESDAVDLDAARLLVEHALVEGDADDAESAIAELKRSKPMLFRPRRSEAVTQAARDVNGHALHRDQLDRAGSVASVTGHRQDVLRYLRLRRRS